jgi:hypothetical protein
MASEKVDLTPAMSWMVAFPFLQKVFVMDLTLCSLSATE